MSKEKVTALEHFKKNAEGELVHIPGYGEEPFTVRLKRPSLLYLCKIGKIPNELLAAAQELYEGESRRANMKERGAVLAEVAKVAMIEPAYEEVKDYLTDQQLAAIWNYTQLGVRALKPFRSPVGSADKGTNSSKESK